MRFARRPALEAFSGLSHPGWPTYFRARNNQYCEGKIPDLAMPGASPWGTDVLIECKTPSPFTSASHAGQGGPRGGTIADVGHLFAHGNTEEGLRLTNLGCAQRGSPHDPPFDHTTGRGYVAARDGVYSDMPFIARTTAFSSPSSPHSVHSAASPSACSSSTRAARKTRSTVAMRLATYSRYRSASYLSHHMQCLSTGIVIGHGGCLAHC